MRLLFLAILAATSSVGSFLGIHTPANAMCPFSPTETVAGSLSFQGCQLAGAYSFTMSSAALGFSLTDSYLIHSNTDGLTINFDGSVDGKPMVVQLSNVTFDATSSTSTTYRSLRFVGTAIPKGSSIVVTGGAFTTKISVSNPDFYAVSFESNIFNSVAITLEKNTMSTFLNGQPGTRWNGVYISAQLKDSTLAVNDNILAVIGSYALVALVYWFFAVAYAANDAPYTANVLYNKLYLPQSPAGQIHSDIQGYLVYHTRTVLPYVSTDVPYTFVMAHNTITNTYTPFYFSVIPDAVARPDTVIFSDNTVSNTDDVLLYLFISGYVQAEVSRNHLTSVGGGVKIFVQACTGYGQSPSLRLDANVILGVDNVPNIKLLSNCPPTAIPVPTPLSGALSAANNTVSVAANDNHFVNNGTFHLFDFNVVQTSKAPMDICGNTYMGFHPTDAADLQAISLVEPQSNFIVSNCAQISQIVKLG